MVLTGQHADRATKRLRAGLVNGLAEDPETLVAGMPTAGFTVESGCDCNGQESALSAWDAIHFDKGLAKAEQIYFDELMKTADAQEGIMPRTWSGAARSGVASK